MKKFTFVPYATCGRHVARLADSPTMGRFFVMLVTLVIRDVVVICGFRKQVHAGASVWATLGCVGDGSGGSCWAAARSCFSVDAMMLPGIRLTRCRSSPAVE